jgi:hypothetical protein
MINKRITQRRKYKSYKNKRTKNKKFKNKRTKKFRLLNCSPSAKHNFTCYSSRSLDKLKHLWNKAHGDLKITTNNSREIWEKLNQNLSKICNDERCWMSQNFMANNLDPELKNHTFAPTSPQIWKKNPNEWLNSEDINKVMRQYEKAYPSFVFIGPSPIDFNKKKLFGQCVWNKLCNFDLNSYIKLGKTKIGIIFNLDPHYKEGSHWICIFIDANKYIFYFDSNADPTPKQITQFIKKVRKQAKELNRNLKYYRNSTEHQASDSECGMYVLFVIIQLLQNKMTPEMFKKRIPDKYMEDLRKVFFNSL